MMFGPARDTSSVDTKLTKCVYSDFKHKLVKNALYSINNFEVFPLVLNQIVQGHKNIALCNAAESFAFPDAICRVIREPKDPGSKNLVKLRKFKNIFQDGVDVLEGYVEKNKLPNDKGANIAMENLLKFFDRYSKPEAAQKLHSAVHKVKLKSDVTIILAHHLLSQLVVCPGYTIDQRSRGSRAAKCPCCREDLSGIFGDTSIGSTAVWHGHLDIIFGPVSIECIFSSEYDDDEADDCKHERLSYVEVKHEKQRETLMTTRTKDQLRAQNIVFSFLQRRFHPDNQHFMVPHIGISEERVQIYFYDSEHDILIEARQENLFVSEAEINMKTVVGLWLVLNYKYFCSGITKEMKSAGYTAGFLKNDLTKRRIYEEQLQFGCGSSCFEHDTNLDYKDEHEFVEIETPLKKRRKELS